MDDGIAVSERTMIRLHRNCTGGLVGNGPSLEPPVESSSYDGLVANAIAAMSYSDLREHCDVFRRENLRRGRRQLRYDFLRGEHNERFSQWLRDTVEDQLIAADERANASYF